MAGTNDDLTPAEQQALDGFMTTDQTVPPPDVADGTPAAQPPAPVEPSAPPPAAPPAPAADAPPAAAPPATPPEPTDQERFAAWRAQHADKTPEELAQLAWNQEQRAKREAFQNRQRGETIEQINTRVRNATDKAAADRAALEGRRTKFAETLAADPDAATRQIAEEQLAAEEARINQAEQSARIDAAIGMASQALPDFAQTSAATYQFGGEMGYRPEELNGISDGRDLVVLGLAHRFATLVKAGIVDLSGNVLAAPQSVAATDPRLTAPTPPATLSSAPARPAGGGAKNPVQQGTDLLAMSDADFDKLPPAELAALMKQLEG